MKLSTKITSLLLALIIILSALGMSACAGEVAPPPDDGTSTAGTTTAAAPVETTPPQEDTTVQEPEPEKKPFEPVDVALAGDTACRIIYSDSAEAGSASVMAASKLQSTIMSLTGVSPKITTDKLKPGEEYDSNEFAILVGNTAYPETAQTMSDITYGAYTVRVVDHKLVVTAFSEKGIENAGKKAVELLKSIASDKSLTVSAETELNGVIESKLIGLPIYEGGVFGSVNECGGNKGMLVVIKNTSADEYRDYLAKLAASGYTEYTSNEINSNSFATYTNDNYTINAGYYSYETSARIIIEPLADPVGLKEDNVYTKVTTSKLTMVGLEYEKSDGGFASNGLSIIIRLEDGRFIVMDGGFNRNISANNLIRVISEQSAEYTKSGDKPVVAAWIITHAHGDHSGLITSQTSLIKRSMKIEKFFVNFISETDRLSAINSTEYSANWSSTEGSGWASVVGAAKVLGTKLQYVHVGQVFYIANLKMEILYTIESYLPRVCNAFNTTSLIIKMTFDSGDTFMMTGDATGNAVQIAAKMFKNYMKCDMLQVSHHGYTTWGNDAGIILGYRYISPEVLLWPVGEHGYVKNVKKEYNYVLFSPQVQSGGLNKSFKESYVAGSEGVFTVLDIPYTIGSAVTSGNP